MRQRHQQRPGPRPGRHLTPREVEDATNQGIQWAPGQEALVGQPAYQDQKLRLDQRELAIEVRTAEVDFGAARAPVSPTRTLARETLGNRGHVDAAPDLLFGGEAGP